MNMELVRAKIQPPFYRAQLFFMVMDFAVSEPFKSSTITPPSNAMLSTNVVSSRVIWQFTQVITPPE